MIWNIETVGQEIEIDLLSDWKDLVERRIERKELGSEDGVPALVAVCICPRVGQGGSAVPLIDSSARAGGLQVANNIRKL